MKTMIFLLASSSTLLLAQEKEDTKLCDLTSQDQAEIDEVIQSAKEQAPNTAVVKKTITHRQMKDGKLVRDCTFELEGKGTQ